MANVCIISVAPEVAAVKTVVDAIRAVDFPETQGAGYVPANNSLKMVTGYTFAIETKVDTIDTVVDAIRAVDVPALDADIATVDAVADAIRATDVANIRSDISGVSLQMYELSVAILHSNDAVVNKADESYVKCKEIENKANETLRIYFELRATVGGVVNVFGRIYKNGVGFGTERMTSNVAFKNYTEDLAFAAGDLIQLYAYTSDNGSSNVEVQNFRIQGVLHDTFMNTLE